MNVVSTKEKYVKTVTSHMMETFKYDSVMSVPKVKKVVVNVGIGKILKEGDRIDEIVEGIRAITGQQPVKTKSHKAIAGFKIREGMEIGVKVTLRGKRMWSFIDRLINSTLPRTRDFQGINKSTVDKGGNLNIGIKEHVIFPEISPEKVRHIFGLQITVVSSARTQEEGLELFKQLGFPFKSI